MYLPELQLLLALLFLLQQEDQIFFLVLVLADLQQLQKQQVQRR